MHIDIQLGCVYMCISITDSVREGSSCQANTAEEISVQDPGKGGDRESGRRL